MNAIGAVGFARAFAFEGAHGNLLWDAGRELPDADCNYDKTGGESDRSGSTLHHFHSKLLRLSEGMNTETGRKVAESRHAFMEYFLARFEAEWMGEL